MGPWAVTSAQDVPALLARNARVSKGVVAEWFAWRRATTGQGDEGVGDPGRVARAEQEAHMARERQRAAQAALEAEQRRAEAQQALVLLVEGEIVELNPDTTTSVWCAVWPRAPRPGCFPPAGSHPVPGHGLLDTGNGACTMISLQTATACGIGADPTLPPTAIRGINGLEYYPRAKVAVRIRGVVTYIYAAIGGSQGVLVGEDVLGPMFARGFSLAGFYGVARGQGGVQWVRQGTGVAPTGGAPGQW